MESSKLKHDVVCFGEILWDILPSGEKPGGAPMNVAYHLKKLGSNPALITKVGADDYGKRLINLISENGISAQYFYIDQDHATGLVYAKPDEFNEVTYDIVNPAAWDFIEWKDDFTALLTNAQFFVYGSLTSRNKISRDTLYQSIEKANTKVLDINLRPPNYHRSHVEYLLGTADILKMNLAELELITGWFSHFTNIEDRIKLVHEQFGIERTIVTMGGDGALINDGGTIHHHAGYNVQVADTIGSGDAFLAGFINNLLKDSSVKDALEFASGMGAFVATCSGACPQYEISQITDLINSDANRKLQAN
jgi:fructokinase